MLKNRNKKEKIENEDVIFFVQNFVNFLDFFLAREVPNEASKISYCLEKYTFYSLIDQ